MKSRSLRFALGLVLGALAIVVFLVRTRATGALEVRASASHRAREIELAAAPTDEMPRFAMAEQAVETRPSLDEAPPAALERDFIEISGWVLESDRQGIGSATVLVRGRTDPAQSGRTTTATDGRFVVRLDAAEWKVGDLANVHVSFASGQRLFTGVVPIERDVTILLPRAVLLHGRVEDLAASDLEDVTLRLDVPGEARFGTDLYVGTTSVERDGRFALSARAPAESSSFLLTLARGKKPLRSVIASLDALTSPDGARIELDMRSARIAFRGPGGDPLQRVLAAATPLGTPNAARLTEISGADGTVDLVLPAGRIEVCASRAGFRSKVWDLDTRNTDPAHAIQVTLVPLETHEALTGVVVLADGRPIEMAYVSVYPRGLTSAASGARVSVHTSKDGTFSVSYPHDEGLTIIATHPAHGESERAALPPGTRHVRIVFESQGKLVLDVEAAPRDLVASAGPIECLLVDRNREHVIRDHIWGSPAPMRSIPEGDYNVFVFWPGMNVFGASPVSVRADETAHCRVDLAPAEWLEGLVVDAAGQAVGGAAVELDSASWWADAARAWGAAASAPDGSFRVLLGKRPPSISLRVTMPDGKQTAWTGASGPALVAIQD